MIEREQGVRVDQEQALAPLDDEHVLVPVVDARGRVDECAGAAAQQREESRGAPQQHSVTVSSRPPFLDYDSTVSSDRSD